MTTVTNLIELVSVLGEAIAAMLGMIAGILMARGL